MSKEAMKLALEALEICAVRQEHLWHGLQKLSMAKNALQAALAKPDFWEGYVPEPVKPAQQALDKKAENARELGLDYKPAQQEPVKAMHIGFDWLDNKQLVATYAVPVATNLYAPDLYTNPPAQPAQPAQQEPLTDEQIVAKAMHLSGLGTSPDVIQFARAIEAAHGIKENT